ncbi:hypothetical protein LCGC14_0293730 [marine sediment metagenome]|uniref:DUF2970 domain-containing protein n=1 Tax=marine sediment metagenome TaxID=412755 RepID=A0A0F9U988_9ZZZZ|nr:DUF2970 domain-containing protein [Halomonas sp.]HDZ49118.1 DUF2970 domain-containing protein [Halomonas sp.]HEB04498.1 DUF2970 domain-containing protein [Halomonas sp.]
MWSIVRSVLAALIGVQKNQRREEDFTSGRPAAFIVTGIIVTLMFVLILMVLANYAAR